jgi:hypothetical protein
LSLAVFGVTRGDNRAGVKTFKVTPDLFLLFLYFLLYFPSWGVAMLSLATQPLQSNEDWPLFSADHPLADSVRDSIVRVCTEDSITAWKQFVDPKITVNVPRLLPQGHWIENLKNVGPDWKRQWEKYWDDPDSCLATPGGADEVAAFLKNGISWEQSTEVIFFRSSRYALITTWKVFLSC